ncbi:type VI secretion system baseplate subunit TssK, partial [Atlantibacter hermannii]|uniref:type VI secretion system baseplate subunit TssK n=1 Tax=Atlantibacter hermannii TaxID=565 RepID=UPI0028A7F0F4
MKAEQPLWGRGIMISPQHFQQQVAYAAWSVECIARMGLNHPWGVIESTFEPEALKLGRLKAHKLHVRFQDGTLVDTRIRTNAVGIEQRACRAGPEGVSRWRR